MGRSSNNNEISCGRKFCIIFNCLGFIAIAGTLVWYFVYFAKDVDESLADCGGCYCIPDNTTSFTCPSAEEIAVVTTSYPEVSHLNVWRSQTILNPYVLNCNPYDDNDDKDGEVVCDTEPPLDPDKQWMKLGEIAVCAVHYEQKPQERRKQQQSEIEVVPNDSNTDNVATPEISTSDNTGSCESGTYYRMKTYPSRSDAETAGGFVTHVGHCGVCSTLQDLAVYANVDFVGVTSPGSFCRRQAVTSVENGLACYRGLGFTQDCARIWSDTSWNTASNCFGSCVLDPTLPIFGGDDFSSTTRSGDIIDGTTNATEGTSSSDSNKWYDLPVTLRERFFSDSDTNTTNFVPSNGPAPGCALNDCLVCNEDISAPTFDKFAGRTRRRSGLLSTAAFPCGSIPNIVQDPCPTTQPLVEQE